jgi:hypothetical protein
LLDSLLKEKKMPARRQTKTVRSTVDVEDEDMLAESFPLLLLDLQSQVKSMQEALDESANILLKNIKAKHTIALNKMSMAERMELYEDQTAPQSDSEDKENDLCTESDEYLSDIRSTVKSSSRGRRVPGGSTVRKSSRKRVAETPLQSRQAPIIATPLNSMMPANLGRTPFITPKFNTQTPLNRILHRQARPNETLVSLGGSPVMSVSKPSRGKAKGVDMSNFTQISLGSMTLSVPMSSDFEVDGLDLDQDQINKLTLIQQGLTNMLGRMGSSESE